MRLTFGILIVAGALCLPGCGSPDAASVEKSQPENAPPPPVKTMLEDLVLTGEFGSGSESLRSELEKIKATDEAKGKAMLADLDRIQKMQEPEQIKAAAKKLLEKL